jgi:hypothetical protein
MTGSLLICTVVIMVFFMVDLSDTNVFLAKICGLIPALAFPPIFRERGN